MQITFASYNIHKAVGLDRKRDPDRIISVLRELDADVIALQEADLRFGERASVLPRAVLDDTPWRPAHVWERPRSIGWHGNALLVRRTIDISHAQPLHLPTLEPRGAVAADLLVEGAPLRVLGMHLDLSGLIRRDQIKAILTHCKDCEKALPTVMLGDLNEWSSRLGALASFDPDWTILSPGRSFPSRRPMAMLDRIVHSAGWKCLETGVHRSPLAAVASDHLPVFARLEYGG